jgi:RNA polymerase sigma factor (sigma-70 family)
MNTRNRIVTAIADVQQEVWLTVYRRIGGLSDPRAFRTWLFQTTRHRAIDFLRARKRERELADGESFRDSAAPCGARGHARVPTGLGAVVRQ